MAIIIFSKHYASSRRCLGELTKIMEFHRSRDQVVLPIFYGVNPSEVHNQECSFGQAFQDLVQRISPDENEVSGWMTALSEAGSVCGLVVPNFESKNESEDIQNIVKLVRYLLDTKDSCATEGLVGVRSQVQEVITMLHKHQSKDVVSLGIWGTGGIGKTTTAKLIFDRIQNEFESTCFFSNVRQAWESKGRVYLQEQLVSRICEAKNMRMDSNESGSLKLKERLRHRKVLVVLDDVNDLEQLRALCGNREWLGEGSKIIITTRDLHLLKTFGVDDIHSMKLLSNDASLELFIRKAFKRASPEGKFMELCRRMVAYAEGLPLALNVLGSSLYGQSSWEWDWELMKLSIIPPPAIFKKLKLSFDSLDGNGKEIFLNIVLFHIGEDKDDVIQKLDGHGCNASIGIGALVDRSLVTIDKNNKLKMHHMSQLMGRRIIHQSSQNNLLKRSYKYDVFLSFRGEDTRATFTSHINSALRDAGIFVFKDDVELPRGNHIKLELLQAIGSSKIAIIIFSRKYAASKWCLDELSLIRELHKSDYQVILPVFYDVAPSEVRSQTSSFGKAFKKLIQKFSPPKGQVSKWRTALRDVGAIAGTVILNSREESGYVKAIVDDVRDILDKKDLYVAEHPVGVDNRMQEVITMLQNHPSEDVVMVGIWGMGGVGKTTIAKAIYNKIGHKFEGRSYLPRIRKVWNQREGKVRLQNQLLSDICKPTKMKINSIESGINILRDRLRHKKALVVVDGVDKSSQLHALVGSRDWFGKGSIVIITTRDRHLLRESNCVVHLVKNLDERESIELFSWHAFRQKSPKEDFIELSRRVVAYSGGLPLALKVFGSYLFARETEEWESVLERIKKIPLKKIQKKLKTSFDSLSDLSDKEIFLDISCFFIGMDKDDVTQILNGCRFFAKTGIKNLEERSLVTIDENNKLGMHNLLRDMGREIIREESRTLGKRSRLWFHKDAQAVLLKRRSHVYKLDDHDKYVAISLFGKQITQLHTSISAGNKRY
ncbi:TMV resistance protein N-like [Neltuma alba]|uniref:TMV resistance protein N-like n=1 Tax=Neltuma alba TaxID=207710 RepID=UPI0010A2EA90|nr:TMV resistance protein N-like [Prosopis alba]